MLVRTRRRDSDRRQFPRYPAVNLMAEIDGRLYSVHDISMGGVRLSGEGTLLAGQVTFLLCPCENGQPVVKDGVKALGTLVGRHDDSIALKFDNPTMPLLKLVVRQASVSLGVEPYIVK